MSELNQHNNPAGDLPCTIMRGRDGWGPVRSFLFGKRRCRCGEKHPTGERFYRLRSNLPGYWQTSTEADMDSLYLEAMLGPKEANDGTR